MNFFSKCFWSVFVGYNYFNENRSLAVKTEVTETTTDERGYPVIHVQADNYIEAMKPVQGTTYPGNVSRAVVKTGYNKWEIRIEPWDTQIKQPKDMTADEYQQYIDTQRGAQ